VSFLLEDFAGGGSAVGFYLSHSSSATQKRDVDKVEHELFFFFYRNYNQKRKWSFVQPMSTAQNERFKKPWWNEPLVNFLDRREPDSLLSSPSLCFYPSRDHTISPLHPKSAEDNFLVSFFYTLISSSFFSFAGSSMK